MRICQVEGCGETHVGRGYCRAHYNKAYYQGQFTDIRPIGRTGCQIGGCKNSHYAKGYCGMHYEHFMRTGSPLGWHGMTVKIDKARLQAALLLRGETYESVGQKLDISKQRIEQYTRTRILTDTAVGVARVLDVPLLWLLGRTKTYIPPFSEEDADQAI